MEVKRVYADEVHQEGDRFLIEREIEGQHREWYLVAKCTPVHTKDIEFMSCIKRDSVTWGYPHTLYLLELVPG